MLNLTDREELQHRVSEVRISRNRRREWEKPPREWGEPGPLINPIYTPGNHVGTYFGYDLHFSLRNTVDGSPANSPVEVDRTYTIFGWGFSTIQTVGFLAGFLNHQRITNPRKAQNTGKSFRFTIVLLLAWFFSNWVPFNDPWKKACKVANMDVWLEKRFRAWGADRSWCR